MREHKYRVWDEEDKIMSQIVSLDEIVSSMPEELFGKYLHHPYIWLEYTGLKDKNGKEIWEGDIIRGVYNRYPQNWVVGELSVYGLFFTRLARKPLPAPYNYRDMRHKEEWEVIGNVWANKELLNEQ